jgi:hypothetical protein
MNIYQRKLNEKAEFIAIVMVFLSAIMGYISDSLIDALIFPVGFLVGYMLVRFSR